MPSDRITWLEDRIRQASANYYAGKETVDDWEYDEWCSELKRLKASSPALTAVGSPPVSEWVKVRHKIPMGSLDKVQTPEEMIAWRAKFAGKALFATDKLDGLSISLEYQGGQLIQALTRGDGEVGEDVTTNVVRMKRSRGRMASIDTPVTGIFRGEIVVLKDDHVRHFPHQANTRNSATGTVRRLDGQGCEHLTVLVYQIAECEEYQPKTEEEQFRILEKLGFVVPSWDVNPDPVDRWNAYIDHTRDQLPWDIDGLVIRLNDLAEQYSLGETNGRPNGAVAFKFPPPEAATILRDIIWQVGGTGRITPVGVFGEVNLLGTKVTRASLYNQEYIEHLKLDLGAKVVVSRANDVIPRISKCLERVGTVAKPPDSCPVCGTPTEKDGEYIICPNTSGCAAQTVGRLKQWVSELGIMEWGESLLQKLVDRDLVRTVADLYRLTKDALASLEGMGDKSAEKVLGTLNSSRTLSLEQFLGAQSIPLCATSTLELVVIAGFDTLEKIQGASVADFEGIPGMGPKRANALHAWLRQNASMTRDLLDAGVSIKPRAKGVLTGKSVCFTGKSVRKRAELEQMVVSAGGTVKNSVGKGLTYLVLSDPNSTSTKAQAAKKNGTRCISEEDFVSLCGGIS